MEELLEHADFRRRILQDEEFDLDALETGKMRETVSSELLSPICTADLDGSFDDPKESKGFYKCHIRREGKHRFWLFSDQGDYKFHLSAVYQPGQRSFYISQYYDFPEHCCTDSSMLNSLFDDRECTPGSKDMFLPKNAVSGRSFCFVLKLDEKNRCFRLHSRFCENCDFKLGLYSCGNTSLCSAMNNSLAYERQVLAIIKHNVAPIETNDLVIECNATEVQLPCYRQNLERDVWCPRTLKGLALESRARNMVLEEGNDISSQAGDQNDTTRTNRAGDPGLVSMKNEKPRKYVPKMKLKIQSMPTASTDTTHDLRRKDATGAAKTLAEACELSYVAESNGTQNSEEKSVGSCSKPKQDDAVEKREIEQWETKITAKHQVRTGDIYRATDVPQTKLSCINLTTKKPRYDPSSNSLRMKFNNNRIQVPSSKNMIFEYIDPQTNVNTTVLQFGKCTKNRFALDFKYPLNIIQAFALALSLFQWQGPKDTR